MYRIMAMKPNYELWNYELFVNRITIWCTSIVPTCTERLWQFLPLSDFCWLERNDIDALDVQALHEDDETGYIFEVDLKYPQHLSDKKNYIVHYRTLKLYIELSMELTAIHRVLSFTRSAWLKPFIEFNTAWRKESRNEFENDLLKLMNNKFIRQIIGKRTETCWLPIGC